MNHKPADVGSDAFSPRPGDRDSAAEHAAGSRAFLASPAEQARLSVVAALAALNGGGGVVDFGCAGGLPRRWLDRDRFALHLSVHIASAASGDAGARSVAGRGCPSSSLS